MRHRHLRGRANNIALRRPTVSAQFIATMLELGFDCSDENTNRFDETPAELAPLDAVRAVAAGYNGELPLTDDEWAVLPTLVAARLALSLTVGSYSAAQDPTNEYLRLTLAPGWRALQRWRATPSEEWARAIFA